MAELTESVGLDISAALESGDQLAQSIGSAIEASVSAAIEGMSTQFAGVASDLGDALAAAATDVPITADASAIPAEVEGALEGIAPTVPVDADTSAAVGAIDEVVAKADDATGTITIDADTATAEAAVEDVAGAVDAASASLDTGGTAARGFGDSTAFAGGVAALATGQIGGLGGAATGLGIGSTAALGGVLALAGGVGILFEKGLDATSALEQFNFIVGDFADKVLNIDVGTLNGDLDDLAIKMGTDDEAMRVASASLFQFGINAGATGDEAATFTNQVDALAFRAVALKPALGDAATVADGLSRAFASGRDRALVPYGIVLDKTAISARALQIATEDGRTEVTRFDTATATAQLAVEKYGNTLGDVVAKGAENAAIRSRSLKEQLDNVLESAGKPLVVPILEAFEQALPVVEALAVPLATIAVEAIPILVAGLEAVTPPLQLVALIMEVLPPELLTAGAAAVVLAISINTVVAAIEAGSVGISTAIPLVGAFAASFIITKSILDAFFGSDAPVDFDKKLSAAEQTARRFAQVADGQLLGAFERLKAQVKGTTDNLTPASEKLHAFLILAEQSPADAQRLIDSLKASGENTAAFEGALDRLLTKQRDERIASDNAATANAALAASYRTPTEAAIEFVTALEKQEEIQNRLINAQLGLTGAAINYERAVISQTKAQEDYNAAVGLFGESSKEAQDAALQLRDADLQLVQSTEALSKAQKELNVDLNDPAAVAGAIQHLKDLQAQYPLSAAAIQPYIDKLNEAALDRQGRLDLDADAFLATLAEVQRKLNETAALSAGYGGLPLPLDFRTDAEKIGDLIAGSRASGGPVEMGKSYIINENTPNSEIFTPGVSGMVQPQIRQPAYAGGGGPLSTTQHIDNSISVDVNAQGQHDPVRIGLAVAKRLRAEQHLAGR